MSKKNTGWKGERQRHGMAARGVRTTKVKRAFMKGATTGFLAVLGSEQSVKSILKRSFPTFTKRDIDKTFDLFVEEGLLKKTHIGKDMDRYTPTKKFYKTLAKELPESQRMELRKKAIAKLGTKAARFMDVA